MGELIQWSRFNKENDILVLSYDTVSFQQGRGYMQRSNKHIVKQAGRKSLLKSECIPSKDSSCDAGIRLWLYKQGVSLAIHISSFQKKYPPTHRYVNTGCGLCFVSKNIVRTSVLQSFTPSCHLGRNALCLELHMYQGWACHLTIWGCIVCAS